MAVINSPWPWMPPKSTEQLLLHCDDTAYVATPDTVMYKLVDAICGTTGAGALVNEVFIARLAGAMETIAYNDLDYVFSNTHFLARAPEESYPYSPLVDMLTAAQWNEVKVKDAWYRARVRDQFIACGLGSTFDGVRMCVQAALSVDCDLYEVWRYVDNFGMTDDLGRAPVSARNELVIKPHKESLLPGEMRLARDMLSRFVSLDTIVTINTRGLPVQTPVPIASAASDSTYYEVQKVVTNTPLISQLPPPELLPIDLLPTEQWVYSGDPTLAPYTAFNISQEYGYYYLAGGGARSPIDSVTYGTINGSAPVKVAVFELSGTFDVVGSIQFETPTNTWYDNLNADFFQWIPIIYQADLYPMNQSVAQGVTGLINAITAWNGPFILVGYSQGAIVTSLVYDEIRSGSLQSRRPDLLAGLAFGNPRRQAGMIWPGGVDPGGHGIMNWDLMTNTEPLWWEFALAGDPIAVIGDDQTGQDLGTLMGFVYQHYTGVLSLLMELIINPIVNAEALIQSILDLFYGFVTTGSPHHRYYDPTYQPIPGDARDCVQIGYDYISSLALPNLAALSDAVATNATMVTVYEVGETTTTTPDSWFSTNLDNRIRYVWVPYPSNTELPLADAIDAGVSNLTTLINRNPGKFILLGTGEGAIVTSNVYDELRTGYMQHRLTDLLAGVAFGNPRREEGVIAPRLVDPGGHGISATRLTDTDDFWWEFANEGDILATTGDDTDGTWMQVLFDAAVATYAGDPSVITNVYPDSDVNVSLMLAGILGVVINQTPSPHTTYSTATPVPGDTRTSFQMARDYINTFALLSTAYTAAPADPMSTYQPVQAFESFVSDAQFGPWQTYEIVDSPDNYPGGKFGKTPSTAPAVNPDGSVYNFPWDSQQAFITAKSEQVVGLGGQADNYHYRLPMGQATVTKEVFLPEYAIAYAAPTQESTVSQSLTRGRPSTVIQTGWAQVFATAGAALPAAATSSGNTA